MNDNNLAWEYAQKYLGYGWAMIRIPYGQKNPSGADAKGWTDPSNWIDSYDRVNLIHGHQCNLGLVHAGSGTVAIDIDDLEQARFILSEFGVNVDQVLASGMRIVSPSNNRGKVVFQTFGHNLKYEKVLWPRPDDQTKKLTVFELRTGDTQDVLPPSAYPGGGFYQWAPGQAPWEVAESLGGYLPIMPQALEDFWQALSNDPSVKERIQQLCPWREEEPEEVAPSNYRVRQRVVSGEHQDIIGRFNATHSVSEILAECGYKKVGRRWMAPESSSKIPGVSVFKDAGGHERAFSHHASDPLNNGYAHDAFDILLLRRYGEANLAVALDDIAGRMGIDRHERRGAEYDEEAMAEVVANILANAKGSPVNVTPVQAGEIEPGAPIWAQDAPQHLPTEKNASDEWPVDILNPPAKVLRIAMDWMDATAYRPQRVLSLAASLSMMATALANKVETETQLRTNLYIIGMADTGEGKDHGRKCISRAMEAAGIREMIAPTPASGPALVKILQGKPAAIIRQDEFGIFLQGVNSVRAEPHSREIGRRMLELFTSAGDIYDGNGYSNTALNPQTQVAYPCLTVYGTTTPQTLWPAFSGADLESGLMGRLLLMQVPDRAVEGRPEARMTETPESVRSWLSACRHIGEFADGMDPALAGPASMCLSGRSDAAPFTIPMDEQARRLMDAFVADCNRLRTTASEEIVKQLWVRAHEHAAKVALVVALADLHWKDMMEMALKGELRVTAAAMNWSIGFVRFLISRALKEISLHVADSEHHALCNEAARILERAGADGGTIAEVSNQSRKLRALNKRERDEVFSSLLQLEAVIFTKWQKMNGRMRSAYVHKSNVPRHLQLHPDSSAVGESQNKMNTS